MRWKKLGSVEQRSEEIRLTYILNIISLAVVLRIVRGLKGW
jgi:hypothetical protein